MKVDAFIKLSLKISDRHLIENCYINFGCTIVGKPLCYHASNNGFDSFWISYYQIPPHAARPTQPSIIPRTVNEYRIIQEPLMMRVPPIDHHLWYDRCLSTYDPGLVGNTMSTKLTEPRLRCAQLVYYFQKYYHEIDLHQVEINLQSDKLT